MLSHSLLIASIFLCCFSLKISGSEPEIEIVTKPVSCNNGSDGVITVKIADISQVFSALLYKYSPEGNSIPAQQENNATIFSAMNLSAGKYFIEIKSDQGFSYTHNIEISQPEKLATGKIVVEKKLSAIDATDAVLMASPSGGVPPYSYSWNVEGENKNTPVLKNVGQGTYSCIINDANNCGPQKVTILFNQYEMHDIVEE